MSAPATIDVLHAVRARLVAQCAGIGAGLAFDLTAPISVAPTADRVAYLLHLAPPDDTIMATGTLFRHAHQIEIRLWMRTPTDAEEETFLAFADAISAAFFQYQTLGGIATTTTITPAQLPPYIRVGAITYRQRVWRLEVEQKFSVIMQ